MPEDFQGSQAVPQPTEPTPVETFIPRPFSWRLFWLLALVVLLAALIGLPYALHVLLAAKSQLAGQAESLRRTVTIRAVLQAILFYWPMTLVGLIAAGRLGLGLPLVSAWIEKRAKPFAGRKILRPSAWLGFGMGFGILAATAALSPWTASELARLNSSIPGARLPGPWQGLLGSLSAAINEEILLRLCLLSGLAWTIQWLVTRRRSGRPGLRILWLANLVTALIFGLLHLPNLTALNVPLSPYLLIFTVGLNGAAGLGFGWLYWTYGLESASLAHFFMDLVLHVLTALLQTLLQ